MKKIISIALALLMVAVMLPVMAMAEGANVVSTPDALKDAVAAGGEVTLGLILLQASLFLKTKLLP